jgi:dihydroorotase-like cyclic amidohydrolase
MSESQKRLLVRGGRVLDLEQDLDEPLIEGGSIRTVGRDLAPEPGAEVIDARGMLVVPASSTPTTTRTTCSPRG